MGELSRGALFNPEHSPYVGLVGVEQIDASTLRLRPIDECSVPERVFPGLLMEKVPVVASVANVIAEWPALWPSFRQLMSEISVRPERLLSTGGALRLPRSSRAHMEPPIFSVIASWTRLRSKRRGWASYRSIGTTRPSSPRPTMRNERLMSSIDSSESTPTD